MWIALFERPLGIRAAPPRDDEQRNRDRRGDVVMN